MTPDEERAALVEEFRARNRERDELEQIKALSRDELPPQEPLPPVDPVDIPPYREPEGAAQGNPYSGMSEPEYQAETADRVAVRQFGGAGGAPPADVVERRAWLDAHAAPSDPDYPPAAPRAPRMTPGGIPPEVLAAGMPPEPGAQAPAPRPGGGGGQGYYQRGVPDVQPVDREKVGAELEALELDRLAGRVDTATYRRKKQEFLSLLDPTKADVARNMTPQQLIAAGMRSKHAAEQAALSGEMAGLDAQSAAAVGRQASIQDALGQVDEVRQNYAEKQKKYQDEFEGHMAKYERNLELFRADKIDPDRFWKRQDTGTQVAMVLAGVLGAVASVFFKNLRGQNMPLQMINRAIDRDMEAQKADMARGDRALGRERGILGMWNKALGDLPQAEAAARIQIYDVLSKKIDAMTSGYQAPALKAKAEALKQQLGHAQEAERANLLAQFKLGAQKSAAAAAAGAADARKNAFLMDIANRGGVRLDAKIQDRMLNVGGQTYLMQSAGGVGERKGIRDGAAANAQFQDLMGEVEQLIQSGEYLTVQGQARAKALAARGRYSLTRSETGANFTGIEQTVVGDWTAELNTLTAEGASQAALGTLLSRTRTSREIVARQQAARLNAVRAVPVRISPAVGVDKEGPMQFVIPIPQATTVQPKRGAAVE